MEVVIAVVVNLVFVTICALKGKYVFAGVGLVLGIFAFVGAIRLAKPESWWARRNYSGEKLERSMARFGGDPESG
jgi:hypothetical protein